MDNEVRHSVTRIWEDVLRLDDLAAGDNFFELGGHSLSASQVISRIRDSLQVEVSLAAFFEYPTIAELAHFVARQRALAHADGPRREKGEG
ncbi:phosphopantetheine-binding protein [Streptantibioticus cattleyicolor]|uniref:AerA n=1 Tax=Streptantibioticus cattleyicolor (strain ATCC 35852 / DSM 46488 / JCM 4925 / NBRC 14057 / NRRL 8057) TaxID=1003195 RepID=F8JJQ4_STREN|nr:phosphopantetheine-binding protein [Streptantibioticus cattleyicolor]AEW99899.1 AerA [Streptantibioticus cattleyicolor NRRL 8057 = DSM 46488]CCB71068.1 protein of unknown function [Streptantibioticus cattleyicolor NRRL 8057 = DSM 46488]